MRSLCADLGSDVGIGLELDATAAKGILDRQGLAKVRHIDVNCLWLQEQCAKKMVPLVKIPGEDNTADLMTKHLVGPILMKHVSKPPNCIRYPQAPQPRTSRQLSGRISQGEISGPNVENMDVG